MPDPQFYDNLRKDLEHMRSKCNNIKCYSIAGSITTVNWSIWIIAHSGNLKSPCGMGAHRSTDLWPSSAWTIYAKPHPRRLRAIAARAEKDKIFYTISLKNRRLQIDQLTESSHPFILINIF
jgi:hypothetical protein